MLITIFTKAHGGRQKSGRSTRLVMQFDSEEEMEPFELSENEFRRGPKRSRKQQREDRIYGQWAEYDSDEETSKYIY